MMNNALKKITVLSLLTTSMIASVSYASPIEGANAQVRKNQKELLRGIIKLGMEKRIIDPATGKTFLSPEGTCSGALVSKNIILTARHCTYQDAEPAEGKKEKELIKKGAVIALNNNEKFIVEDVLRYDTIYTGENENRALTDVALIRVSSKEAVNPLDKLPIISVATPAVEGDLTSQILMAGYGMTDWKKQEVGTLNAGINMRLNSFDDLKKAAEGIELDKEVENLWTQGMFVVGGARSTFATFKLAKGKKLAKQLESAMNKMKVEESIDPNPMALPGDSGGPAIAFDDSNKPYIVGVASQTAPQTAKPFVVLEVLNQKNQSLFGGIAHLTGDEATDQKVMKKAMAWTMGQLQVNKLLSDAGVILENVSVKKTQPRLAISIYASVTHSLNQDFITKGIAELEQKRDAK